MFAEYAVHAMRKISKLSVDGGDSGKKKCKLINNGIWRSRNGNRGREKNTIANDRHAFNTKKVSSLSTLTGHKPLIVNK
jgi:hypothetical protein